MANRYWVGGAGTWDNSSTANWSLTSGGTAGAAAPTASDSVIFDASSGTGTVSVAATAVANDVTANAANITVQLEANSSIGNGSGYAHQNGTLDLNNFSLTCNSFTCNTTNARTVAFGTSGKIVCSRTTSASNTVDFYNATTAVTLTGTPLIEFTGATAAGVSVGLRTQGASPTTPINVNIKAGSGTFNFSSGFGYGSVDFTGFTGTLSNIGINLYGNITYVSGMTLTAGTATLICVATSGTQKITTAGKTLDFPITQNGAGGTVQLQDNLTMEATRTYTLTRGTLDLTGNSGNWTLSAGLFASSNSNTRVIAFGTGNITLTGSGTVWNTGTVTGLSYTGTPTVNVSNNSATATTVSTGALSESQALNFNYTIGTYTLTDTSSVYKSLSFSGFTGTVPNSARTIYGNLTLAAGATNSAGTNATTFAATSGTQQITTNGVTMDYPLTFNGTGGTFAFQDALTQGSTRAFTITNGTVQLKAGATATVGALATSGTNQKVLQSTSAGSQATLSQASGNFNAQYLTVKDIAATGGAKFNGLNNCITQGNNSGWYFAPQLGRPLPAFAF